MKKNIIVFIISAFVILVGGCYYDKEQLLYPNASDCTGVNDAFSVNVNPIIQNSCNNGSGCHGKGSTNGPGQLLTYDQIKNAAAQIQSSVNAGRMPLGSSLNAADIQSINCWVIGGMQNN